MYCTRKGKGLNQGRKEGRLKRGKEERVSVFQLEIFIVVKSVNEIKGIVCDFCQTVPGSIYIILKLETPFIKSLDT